MNSVAFPRLIAIAIVLVSGTALALAFLAQHGFDLWPCLWCFRQRVPYAATLGFGLLCLLPGVDTRMMRHAVMLCALLFAINTGMAAYHAGLEYGWWTAQACGGVMQRMDVGDLMKSLSRPAPQCDKPAIQFLGISMAGANVIVCALMTAFLVWAATRKRRWEAP